MSWKGLGADMRRRGMSVTPPREANVDPGPLLPFARLAIAAVQLHRTGHSCSAHRDRAGKVCYAGHSCHSPHMLSLYRSLDDARKQGQEAYLRRTDNIYPAWGKNSFNIATTDGAIN